MGQRLVVKCIYDKELIATIYYHWSGFTISSLEETKSILDSLDLSKFYNEESKEDIIFQLINYLEKNGGGVDVDDRGLAKECFSEYNFSTNVDRNCGLLAFSPDNMESMINIAEGIVEINFDTCKIHNDVLAEYDIDDYLEYFCDGNDENLYIPSLDFDLIDIGFNDLEDVIERLKRGDSFAYINSNNSLVYTLYE